MAKSASPIRLQEELMQSASDTAKRFHLSTAEQIEYWADIGRQATSVLDPDVLIALTSGLTRIKVESVGNSPNSPDDVFADLEKERTDGTLSKNITGSAVKYQVCGSQH